MFVAASDNNVKSLVERTWMFRIEARTCNCEFISRISFAGMNGLLELRIITQPYSEVYWGYFGRLLFGNSLTKYNKISSFSYSVVICFLPLSHIPPCYHANPPDFPRLFGPRDTSENETLAICQGCLLDLTGLFLGPKRLRFFPKFLRII